MAFKMRGSSFKHTGKKVTHPGPGKEGDNGYHTGHLQVTTTKKKKPSIKMTTTSKPKT